MPSSNWTKAVSTHPNRCHQQIRFYDEKVRLPGYEGLIRQIAVTGLGRDNPTLFLCNSLTDIGALRL